jgi:6-phosphofructokinase 1
MPISSTNAVVFQSGGSTPVINRSLAGVVSGALASDRIDRVYGARRGIEGLIDGGPDRLPDLTDLSAALLRRIARTPGAALGSTRKKATGQDIETALATMRRLNIGYCFLIGGNDSAETGYALAEAAKTKGIDLAVLHVPKTIDNDLVGTDHCPGYGSAARFVALATMGAGRDAETMGDASPIAFIEVMGRDAGWLPAAAVLGKREERDAPHVLGLPEVPIDEQRFTDAVEKAYKRYGFAVAVVSENTRGVNGVLGGDAAPDRPVRPNRVDPFGHPYFPSPAAHLASLAEKRLGVRVRVEKPGTIQRSMAACVSSVDADEAEQAGKAAVAYALAGHSGEMVALQRAEGRAYGCEYGLAPLSQVEGAVKALPPEFLDPDRYFATKAFADYARPLIGAPLPRFGRID